MSKPTETSQPQRRYKDAHGALVIVENVSHSQVMFYHDGYQSSYVRSLARLMKEFAEVNKC